MAPAAAYAVAVYQAAGLPDPSGLGYREDPTLDQLWQNNRTNIVTNGVFEIGDLAMYGPPYRIRHVAVCSSPGVSVDAMFRSPDAEGVRLVKLAHRYDILAVVRPGEPDGSCT